jgi:16S rRNA (cytidine1402-2'-O)-methyltransferase
MSAAAPPGRLLLVPNALDFGLEGDALPPVQDALPMSVLRTAAGLRHWAVENAKSARAFLKRVAEVVPLACPLQDMSICELPRAPKGSSQPLVADAAWRKLLQPALAGADVGLLSEAGLPAVADPGATLVRHAHELGLSVVALPGSSAIALAVAASGLNGQSFAFVGYLPTQAAQRVTRLRELEAHSRRWQQTQLMIETPYRNAALLAALLQTLAPATWLSVSCGLTLPSGFTHTARVKQWREAARPLPTDLPAMFAFLAD